MKNVYSKCDLFEKERLEFFTLRFVKLQNHLNIYEKKNVQDIYDEYLRVIKETNSERDLSWWSREFGCGMPMNWPIFEEYSEEFKTIARGARASKLVKDVNPDYNGITITSIKQKNEEVNEGLDQPLSSLNHNSSSDANKYVVYVF
jgi:hypothetical protein